MSARTLLLLVVLGAAAWPMASPAQERGSGIQRCERGDGSQVYTDQDCGVFGAAAAPLPGELLVRLASDGGDGIAIPGAPDTVSLPPPSAALGAGSRPDAREHASRHAPAGATRGCARSPIQLVMELRAAWEAGDVNRIAAFYHWAGSGTAEATSVMSRLQSLARLPLQDVRHYGGAQGLIQVASAAAVPIGGIVQVSLGDGDRPRLYDFQVVDHQGCRFIRF